LPISGADFRARKLQALADNEERLLGIEWGLLNTWEPVCDETGEPVNRSNPEAMQVCTNAGMMGVVPAWKLAEMLDSGPLAEHREEQEKIAMGGMKKNGAPSLHHTVVRRQSNTFPGVPLRRRAIVYRVRRPRPRRPVAVPFAYPTPAIRPGSLHSSARCSLWRVVLRRAHNNLAILAGESRRQQAFRQGVFRYLVLRDNLDENGGANQSLKRRPAAKV
jgi:hypothetical protein